MSAKIRVALGAAILVLFSGCPHVFRPPSAVSGGTALVSFTFYSGELKTALPEFDARSYRLKGARQGGGEILLAEFDSSAGTSLALDPGTWNFSLEAYDGSGRLILTSRAEGKEIVPGEQTSVVFTLLPLNSGQGSIAITVVFPQAADITRLVARCGDDELVNLPILGNSSTYHAVKDAGSYFVSIEMYSRTDLRAVVSELALVRGNVTSQKTVTVEMADMAPLNLEERFVMKVAQGAGDGSSWDNASDDLQRMIDEAHYATLLGAGRAIVHVAAGTYVPRYKPDTAGKTNYNTDSGDRDSSFIMRPAVELRGGYAASGENIDEETRGSRFDAAGNPVSENFRVVLSGDFYGNDGVASGGLTNLNENSRHVILAADIPADGTAILDGFTVRGGNADSQSFLPIDTGSGSRIVQGNSGGGVYIVNASPVLINLCIEKNSAAFRGAGIFTENSQAIVGKARVTENFASGTEAAGGGIFNMAGSPVMGNVIVAGNSSGSSGGGVYNEDARTVIVNTLFTGNSSGSSGGAMYNSGGEPFVTNTTFSGNSSGSSGGAVFNARASAPKLNNVILWGNGSEIINDDSGGVNTPELVSAIIEGGWSGTGSSVKDANPLFIDPRLPSQAPTVSGDFRLQSNSPAINSGSNDRYPDTWTKWYGQFGNIVTQNVYNAWLLPLMPRDISGDERMRAGVDLGAYEEPGGKTPDNRERFVTQNGNGDGSSWARASGDLQAMIDAAYQEKQSGATLAVVHVAAGVYKPRYKPNADGSLNLGTASGDRDAVFVLRPGVELRGGYSAAGEDISEETRKSRFGGDGAPADEQYRARLSGDFTGMGVNAYHVVLGVDIPADGTTVLDGFTLAGGNADGSGVLEIRQTGSQQARLIGRDSGGGIYNVNSSPVLVNVYICENNAAGNGGGVYNDSSSPVLLRASVCENTAASGGGIYNSSGGAAMNSVAVSRNSARSGQGGGIYNDTTSLMAVNAALTGNLAASEGGAFYNKNSRLSLANATVAGNSASGAGDGLGSALYNTESSPLSVMNSIVWGNSSGIEIHSGTLDARYSIVQDGCPGVSISFINPLFVNGRPHNEAPATAGDYTPQQNSPAINAGNNDLYPATWAQWVEFSGGAGASPVSQSVYDLRIAPAMSGDAAGAARRKGSRVDMGAYEEQSGLAPDLGERFVRVNGSGSGNSWADASGDLQKMIDESYAAAKLGASVPVVHVAAGKYTPRYKQNANATTNYEAARDREAVFFIRPGVELRGGYISSGEDISEAVRKLRFAGDGKVKNAVHQVILSGDFSSNDSGNAASGFTGTEENSYHVVLAVDIPDDGKTVIDGFTISGGNADTNSSGSINTGAGNRSISHNNGAGVHSYNSSPVLSNLVITGNSAANGGGVYNASATAGAPLLVIITSSVTGNVADGTGGGIHSGTGLAFVNGEVSGNRAGSSGGGIYNSTAAFAAVNIVISGNAAATGGAMYNNASSAISPKLFNAIVAGNRASGTGGGINHSAASHVPVLRNCIIWGNSNRDTISGGAAQVYFSTVENGWPGANAGSDNSGAKPLFISAGNYPDAPAVSGNYRPLRGSPVINSGTDGQYPNSLDKWRSLADTVPVTQNIFEAFIRPALDFDAQGGARVKGGILDKGAYEDEFGETPEPDTGERYVVAGGTGDGKSWAGASGDIQKMIDEAYRARLDGTAQSIVHIAAGTYKPRYAQSSNGVTDDNTQTGSRDATFFLRPGVELRGGYTALGETINETVRLSRFSGDGVPQSESYRVTLAGEAVHHVVLAQDIPGDNSAVLDGFTVTGGSANGSGTVSINTGPGTRNISRNSGGGIYAHNASVILKNALVTGNSSDGDGGGIYNASGSSLMPILLMVNISGNTSARSGGGIYNAGDARLLALNTSIAGNSAAVDGGGIGAGSTAELTLINTAITGNAALGNGGGIYVNYYTQTKMFNVSVAANRATGQGGGFYIGSSSATVIYNSIIWGNSTQYYGGIGSRPTFHKAIVQGHTDTAVPATVTNSDPLFIDQKSFNEAQTTAGDYRLRPSSNAIEEGLDGDYPDTAAQWNSLVSNISQDIFDRWVAPFADYDLAGNARRKGTVDLGPYEEHSDVAADSGERFVRAGATGDGLSWDNASGDIQKMTDDLYRLKLRGAQKAIVHVAAGVYRPRYALSSNGITDYNTQAGNRDATFMLRPGVELRGGYRSAGETTVDEAERKARFNSDGTPKGEEYRAVLSGDFAGDDGGSAAGGFTGMAENAHHIVFGFDVPADGKTVLDGFTVSGGSADGSGNVTVNGTAFSRGNAAGIRLYNASPVIRNTVVINNSSNGNAGGFQINGASLPEIVNVTVADNAAGTDGGAFYIDASAPRLTRVTVSGNRAGASGGGMFNNNVSVPLLVDVNISGNSSTGTNAYNNHGGGGMYNRNSTPLLTNVTLSGNNAGRAGGGMYNGASSPVVTGALISGNYAAGNGGGIYNDESSSPILTNVTVAGNRAAAGGAMLNAATSAPIIRNSIIHGNSGLLNTGVPAVYYSIIQGGWTGSGSENSGMNPSFIEMSSASQAPTTAGDYRLSADSPAINRGEPAYYPATWAQWLLNFDTPVAEQAVYTSHILPALGRDVSGGNRSSGASIDIGAFEEQSGISPLVDTGIRYVRADATGDGKSWAGAAGDLQSMIDDAYTAKLEGAGQALVNVAAGTYTPRYRPSANMTTDYATPERNRDATFFLRPGVELRGGYTFAGENIGEAERKARFNSDGTPKSEEYRAILSGDFAGDDGGSAASGFTGMAENAHRVVLAVDIPADSNTVLDGFTVSGGNANGSGNLPLVTSIGNDGLGRSYGGGVRLSNASPILTNVVISRNSSSANGAGIYNSSASVPILTGVTVSDNRTEDSGGGIANVNSSTLVLINALISGNYAKASGGGIYNNGSTALLTNALVSGNYAGADGGGLYASTLVLTNVTVAGNNAVRNGGGVFVGSGTSVIRNTLIWGNSTNTSSTPELYYSTVQGYAPPFGSQNSDIDPWFIDQRPYQDAASAAGNYRVNLASSAINSGEASYYPDSFVKWSANVSSSAISEILYNRYVKPALEKDLGGQGRYNSAIDRGAYEDHGDINSDSGNRYVTEGGSGDGTSWAAASGNIQRMMDELYQLKKRGAPNAVVHVAAGIYKPLSRPTVSGASVGAAPSDRDNTFYLRPGVEVRGGYAEGETINEETRKSRFNADGTVKSTVYRTVLSGDVIGNDTGNAADGFNLMEDNVYHVVLAVDIPNDGKTVLDGFTVSGGNAAAATAISINMAGGAQTVRRDNAGGIRNYNASPVLRNIVVTGNNALGAGGGIANTNASSPDFGGVTVSNNRSASNGGGMYNDGSAPVLTNLTVSANTAASGGGMYNDNDSRAILSDVTVTGNTATGSGGGGIRNNSSSPLLRNVIISENKTSGSGIHGGGMYNASSSPVLCNVTVIGNETMSSGSNGGGMYNASSSSPVLVNTVIAANRSTNQGGGIFNTSSSPVMINVTLAGNAAGGSGTSGGSVYNTVSSSPRIYNSILWGNSGAMYSSSAASAPQLNNTVYEGGWTGAGAGNSDSDPLMVNVPPHTDAPANTGNYRPGIDSAAIDFGSSAYYPDTWAKWTDIAASSPVTQALYNGLILPALAYDPDGGARITDGEIDAGAYEH